MMRLQLCSYVIFTAVVVLSERVEATVQKGFFRFLGTVIGGRECSTVLQHQCDVSDYLLTAASCTLSLASQAAPPHVTMMWHPALLGCLKSSR
jgi:uncharacterized membrane protein YccC